jgi:hypothetical protein
MTQSLAEKFGLSIEPSRLTDEQRSLLDSDDYYLAAARSIGTGRNILVQVDRRGERSSSIIGKVKEFIR